MNIKVREKILVGIALFLLIVEFFLYSLNKSHAFYIKENSNPIVTGIANSKYDYLSEMIISLENTGDSSWNVVNENGYRYEGDNPSNYLSFSGSTYRIIGSFKGSDIGLIGDDANKYFTKIIAASSEGLKTWNDTDNNTWSSSTLYSYLNNDYYSYLNQKSYVKEVSWYLGGLSSSDASVYDIFSDERGSFGGADNSSLTSLKARVGLMYASDYGYGVLASKCDRTKSLYKYNETTACYQNNWLYNDEIQGNGEWLINPHQDYTSVVFEMRNDGKVDQGYTGYGIVEDYRPVLYLDSDVIVVSGNGTVDKPYVIRKSLTNQVMSLTGKSFTDQNSYPWSVVDENGYRYEGKNPDNYVILQNDLYRIIGVFDEYNAETDSTEKLVKLIKNESIGNYYWSGSSSNQSSDWSTSLLNKNILNNTYYNSLSENKLIAQTTYHLGEINWISSEGSFPTADGFYQDERSNIAQNAASINSKVALMYPSDYLYGVLASACSRSTYAFTNSEYPGTDYFDIPACYNQNWLYSGQKEWLLSPLGGSSLSGYAMYIYAEGYIGSNDEIPTHVNELSLAVRPVFYLKPDTLLVSGSGTTSSPYVIE